MVRHRTYDDSANEESERAVSIVKPRHLVLTLTTIALMLISTVFAGSQLFEKRFEGLEDRVDAKIVSHDQNIYSHAVMRAEVAKHSDQLDSLSFRQQRIESKLDEIQRVQSRMARKLGID